jgi:hypothetical protein
LPAPPRGATGACCDRTANCWGGAIDAVPVYPPHAPDRRAGFILAAAGAPGARQSIESWLQHCGLRPYVDYLAVA